MLGFPLLHFRVDDNVEVESQSGICSARGSAMGIRLPSVKPSQEAQKLACAQLGVRRSRNRDAGWRRMEQLPLLSPFPVRSIANRGFIMGPWTASGGEECSGGFDSFRPGCLIR